MPTETFDRDLSGLVFTLVNKPYLASARKVDTPIDVAEFEQVGTAEARITAFYEAGQRQIIRMDPNDSQEGFPATLEIESMKLLEPMVLECNGMTLTIPAGFAIHELMTHAQIREIEKEEIEHVSVE